MLPDSQGLGLDLPTLQARAIARVSGLGISQLLDEAAMSSREKHPAELFRRANVVRYFQSKVVEFPSNFYLWLPPADAWKKFWRVHHADNGQTAPDCRHEDCCDEFERFYGKEQLARVKDQWPLEEEKKLIEYGLRQLLRGHVDSEEMFPRYRDIFTIMAGMDDYFSDARRTLSKEQCRSLNMNTQAVEHAMRVLDRAGECANVGSIWTQVARHFGKRRATTLLTTTAHLRGDTSEPEKSLLDQSLGRFFYAGMYRSWVLSIDPNNCMCLRDLCLLTLDTVRSRSTLGTRLEELVLKKLTSIGLRFGMVAKELAVWKEPP